MKPSTLTKLKKQTNLLKKRKCKLSRANEKGNDKQSPYIAFAQKPKINFGPLRSPTTVKETSDNLKHNQKIKNIAIFRLQKSSDRFSAALKFTINHPELGNITITGIYNKSRPKYIVETTDEEIVSEILKKTGLNITIRKVTEKKK